MVGAIAASIGAVANKQTRARGDQRTWAICSKYRAHALEFKHPTVVRLGLGAALCIRRSRLHVRFVSFAVNAGACAAWTRNCQHRHGKREVDPGG